MASYGKEVGLTHDWVHQTLAKPWKQMYTFKVEAVSGAAFWSKCRIPSTLLPLHYHVAIGRPGNKCNAKGHNKRACTCPKQTMEVKKNARPEGVLDCEPSEVAGGSGQPIDSQATQQTKQRPLQVGIDLRSSQGDKGLGTNGAEPNQHLVDNLFSTKLATRVKTSYGAQELTSTGLELYTLQQGSNLWSEELRLDLRRFKASSFIAEICSNSDDVLNGD
ncbi:hypothetical protein Tco_0855412 [Tanacetum coccineum]